VGDERRGGGIEVTSRLARAELSRRGESMSLAYGGKELAEAFRTVRKNTIQVAEDIPETKYDHVAAPEARSVRQMLSHVAISTRIWEEVHKKGLTTLVGFDFFGVMDKFNAEEAKTRSKVELVQLLRTEGDKFAVWMETLTPEFLAETVTEPDGKTAKTRFERLLGAKEHEMHHRAQLMLIERQLGIVPHLTRQFQERVAQMRAARA
jgi:uncharacterized damage-inducible protein DinB